MLVENETQGEWTLPNSWVWNRGPSFRASKPKAIIPNEQVKDRHSE